MHAIRILSLVYVLLFGVQARAQYDQWQQCQTGGQSPMVYGYVDVGRDAVTGDVIGPWLRFPLQEARQHCTYQATPPLETHDAPRARGTLKVGSFPNTKSLMTFMIHEGQQYAVYRVKTSTGYIGYIMKWRFSAPQHAGGSVEVPVNVPVDHEQIQEILRVAGGVPQGTPVHYDYELYVRMIKIDANFPRQDGLDNTVHFQAARLGLQTYRQSYGQAPDGSPGSTAGTGSWDQQSINHHMYVQVKFMRVNASCKTPSVHVDLGQVYTTDLPDSNTPMGSGSKSFSFWFNDCPRYLHAIRYKFVPVPAGALISDGVLPLIAPSTATGVGVQVAHSSDADVSLPPGPLKFGVEYKKDTELIHLIDANAADYASHPDMTLFNTPLHLQARMVRLNPGIPPTAGTVRAQMKVVATYK